MTDCSTTWPQRARAAAAYLGFLPLFLLFPTPRSGEFSRHHFRQAGALFAVLAALALALAATALSLSYVLVFHRGFYEDFQLERYSLGILRKLLLAWGVFWAFGLALALLGSSRPMPLVQRIARRKTTVPLACAALVLAFGAVAVLVPLALHGRALAPPEVTEGPIHFLYEDNGMFPRWLFVLAFYPMTRTAVACWGPESVAIQRFDRDSVFRAAAQAEAIYMGTHGTPKGLMLEGGWLVPEDLRDVEINPGLRFVYLSGCDSGQQREGWVAAFAPAEVITYDRLSAVLEHVWWLWFKGPAKLRSIHRESSP